MVKLGKKRPEKVGQDFIQKKVGVAFEKFITQWFFNGEFFNQSFKGIEVVVLEKNQFIFCDNKINLACFYFVSGAVKLGEADNKKSVVLVIFNLGVKGGVGKLVNDQG